MESLSITLSSIFGGWWIGVGGQCCWCNNGAASGGGGGVGCGDGWVRLKDVDEEHVPMISKTGSGSVTTPSSNVEDAVVVGGGGGDFVPPSASTHWNSSFPYFLMYKIAIQL